MIDKLADGHKRAVGFFFPKSSAPSPKKLKPAIPHQFGRHVYPPSSDAHVAYLRPLVGFDAPILAINRAPDRVTSSSASLIVGSGCFDIVTAAVVRSRGC